LKTAAVIGVGGMVGRAVARALEAHGYSVRGAQRRAAPIQGLVTASLDREDTASLRAFSAGADVLVDVVAYDASHGRQLAELASDVGGIVVISTGSVYADGQGRSFDVTTGDHDYPSFPVPIDESQPMIAAGDGYGARKAALERVVSSITAAPVTILRAAAVHGPYATRLREWYFIKRSLDRRPHVVFARGGRSVFSTIAADNLAELVALAAEQPGHRVLNAADAPLTISEMATIAFQALETDVRILHFEGPKRGLLGNNPWDAAHPFVQAADRARTELGYAPIVDYAESVLRERDWVLAEIAGGRDWGELFPSVIERHGRGGWFPYELEDAWIAGLA